MPALPGVSAIMGRVHDSGRFRKQDLCHLHIASFRKSFQCVEDAVGAGIHRDG
jgi:hypothetical protein